MGLGSDTQDLKEHHFGQVEEDEPVRRIGSTDRAKPENGLKIKARRWKRH